MKPNIDTQSQTDYLHSHAFIVHFVYMAFLHQQKPAVEETASYFRMVDTGAAEVKGIKIV